MKPYFDDDTLSRLLHDDFGPGPGAKQRWKDVHAALDQIKTLETTLRALFAEVTKEYGEQPGVPIWVETRDLLKKLGR